MASSSSLNANDPTLTDEQREVRRTFHGFAEREIRPAARALDEHPRFPMELFRRAGELGFFGMRYPASDEGGGGADLLSYLIAVEELAWGSLSVACACTMQSLMGTHFLHRFARGALRERLLGPALRGEIVAAICMTEPDAGSDLHAIATWGREQGGRWVLDGRKTWITSAPVADVFTVFARTGEKELSVFLLERGARGLEVGRSIEKMGVRGSLTSEVALDGAEAACLLGERGMGASYLREILAETRLMTAALALGLARAAVEDAAAYAAQRRQFGRTIDQYQAIQAHLADNAVDLEAARQLVRWAAARRAQGLPCDTEASMAKLFASEAAHRICDRAARILASYGFATDLPVERYLRDARFLLIGGGTSEILRINIARELSR